MTASIQMVSSAANTLFFIGYPHSQLDEADDYVKIIPYLFAIDNQFVGFIQQMSCLLSGRFAASREKAVSRIRHMTGGTNSAKLIKPQWLCPITLPR